MRGKELVDLVSSLAPITSPPPLCLCFVFPISRCPQINQSRRGRGVQLLHRAAWPDQRRAVPCVLQGRRGDASRRRARKRIRQANGVASARGHGSRRCQPELGSGSVHAGKRVVPLSGCPMDCVRGRTVYAMLRSLFVCCVPGF